MLKNIFDRLDRCHLDLFWEHVKTVFNRNLEDQARHSEVDLDLC